VFDGHGVGFEVERWGRGRAVDHAVDVCTGFQCGVEDAAAVVLVGDVRFDGVGVAAFGEDHFDGFFDGGGVEVHGDDFGAVACGHEGDGAPVAHAGAGALAGSDHDDDFAGQVEGLAVFAVEV